MESVRQSAQLYRILPADSTYDANSFNMNRRPLGDREQGRFEPTDPSSRQDPPSVT